MAFVDEINISARAGRGGSGVVRWLHEKGKDLSGPSGGNGGGGGNVYVKAVSDVAILASYKGKKVFAAERGQDGAKNSMHGKNGKDLEIALPIGSIITNLNTGKKIQLLKLGEKAIILKGGRGGLGNEHFKGSKNVTPTQWTDGKEGEEADFHIELELFADIGIAGLPNAGKSSLLNSITNATAKIGSYQFTTLEPNLGSLYGIILADIPGLIEGASEGRGLGHKFLRHIKRTKMILHCISCENEDVLAAYKTIRAELEKYGEGLSDKKEIILLTKTDLVDEKTLQKLKKSLSKKNKEILGVSILDDASLKNLKDYLTKAVKAIE